MTLPSTAWKAGEPSPNPLGRPKTGFQSHKDRSQHILERYSRSEILAIASIPERLDKEVSSFDALIITNLANAFKNEDALDERQFAALERERFLDRFDGKSNPAPSTKVTVNIMPMLVVEGQDVLAHDNAADAIRQDQYEAAP